MGTAVMARLAQLRLFGDCDAAELEAAESLLTEVTVPTARAVLTEGGIGRQVVVVDAPRAAPRRRVRDLWIGVALLALAALALGTLWVLDQRTKTTPFTLDDASTELHQTDSRTPAPGRAVASASDSTGASSTASGAQGTTASDPAATPARRSITAAAPGTGTGMPLPAAGVYTYATSGGENISMLGGKHDYPEQTHSIVTHTGGCGWNIEHRVIEEHVDRYGRCSTGGSFQLLEVSREVEFFSQRDGMEYMCQSPFEWVSVADVAGTTHRAVCTSGANDKVEMTVTITGRGTRTIGGTTVATISYVSESKMSGRATGSARTETVVDATTGLLLYEHRVVDTDASTVFGDVHYDEDVVFNLLSLTPAN